jgi:triacylglycerol lipase
MATPLAEPWRGRMLAETRWTLELCRLLVDPVFAGFGLPQGNGRPVLLLPGFLAGDQTLAPIAAWLHRIGYRPHLCRFLLNADCADRTLERLERTLVDVTERSDHRVAVVGHSHGGHLARALAARRPELVSHAVSLGTDLHQMLDISTATLWAVERARRVLIRTGRARSTRCFTGHCDCRFGADFARPFPADRVRMTTIYSKEDGVVQWRAQVVPYADCVEVKGSHIGLIFNRSAYRAIADALAQPELA